MVRRFTSVKAKFTRVSVRVQYLLELEADLSSDLKQKLKILYFVFQFLKNLKIPVVDPFSQKSFHPSLM